MTAQERVRYLDRLMGADPTEDEVREMWQDRPRLEQLLALREQVDPGYDGPYPLQAYDYELWRAKMRAELGSLTGVLDGLAICQENSLILPVWLIERSKTLIAFLGLPDDTPGYDRLRSAFQAERKKLKMQKRAQIVHSLYVQEQLSKKHPEHREWFERFRRPVEVQIAIERGLIRNPLKITSIREASKIAHVCLKSTWARSSEETIRQAYQVACAQIRIDLDASELSPRQQTYIFWDVAHVRIETIRLLNF